MVRSLLLTRKLSLSGIFINLVSHGMNVIVFGKEPEGYDLFWYCLRDAVNADKILSSAIIVYDKFTTILWQYIIFLFWMVYLSNKQYSRLRSVSMMRTSILNTATTEQMGYDIVSFFRLFSPNKSDDTSSEQAVVFWFLPPYPSQKLLNSFLLEPKHRKKKYCPIPDAASERV